MKIGYVSMPLGLEPGHTVGTSNATKGFHEVTETWVILQQRVCWLLQQYGCIHAYRQHHQKHNPWFQLVEIKTNLLSKQENPGVLIPIPKEKNIIGDKLTKYP